MNIDKCMDDLLKKILANPSNEKILDFLNVDRDIKPSYLKKWIGGRNGPDEGGTALLDKFGKEVPENCKYELSIHTLMIHRESGLIFAFNYGRYSMFFRCDFERSGLENTDDFRRGYTFDCIHDITMWGEDWAFLEHAAFWEEEEQQLRWAYEKLMKQ